MWLNLATNLMEDFPIRSDLLFLPGHDRYSQLAPLRDRYLKELAAFLRGSHVIAYSMGARLALWSLYNQGILHDISSLTLISGHIGLQSDSARKERFAKDVSLGHSLLQMDSKSYREFLLQWNNQSIFEGREINENELRLRGHASALGVGSALIEYSTSIQPDVSSYLESISFPTTFIVGSKDVKYQELATIAQRANPSLISRVVVDGVSHDVLSTKPRHVESTLRSTLSHFFDSTEVTS